MTIVVIMLLTMDGFIAITELSMQAYLSLFSMVIGAVALGLCFAVIGFWLSKPVGIMNCYRAKKNMLPTLITWIVSLILGTHAFL
jgi:hypothetical protein